MSNMSSSLGKLLRRGKVKDVYEVDQDKLLFHFTDRVSAFDVILSSIIPRKGEVLCKFAEFWFNKIGINNHMIEIIDNNKMIVKKLEIIPIECVVRGYIYGSLYERFVKKEIELASNLKLASKLPEPIFDPTTKFEEKDRLIEDTEIISNRWLNEKELRDIKKVSIDLYKQMSDIVSKVGFIMADVKLEFGKDKNGTIILADSIGPDEFRLWLNDQYKEGYYQESYDKQLIRDWLTQVGYKKKLDESRKNGLDNPHPPNLPEELILKVLDRYIQAYEKITGRKFD